MIGAKRIHEATQRRSININFFARSSTSYRMYEYALETAASAARAKFHWRDLSYEYLLYGIYSVAEWKVTKNLRRYSPTL